MSDTRRQLLDLLVERSVLLGDFTLTSGLKSSYYVDTKLTSTSATGMTLIGPAFLDLFAANGWWKPDAVIGMTLGADPLLGAISYASALRHDPIDHLIVRKEPKGHGTRKWMEGRLEGVRRVIVVDDVWTTGGSTVKAIEAARESGMEVVAAAALVDREQGGRQALAPVPAAALFTLNELLAAKGVKTPA
jgi:orotate phosphoribosyltransferase